MPPVEGDGPGVAGPDVEDAGATTQHLEELVVQQFSHPGAPLLGHHVQGHHLDRPGWAAVLGTIRADQTHDCPSTSATRIVAADARARRQPVGSAGCGPGATDAPPAA